ncbi:hypothetical protein SAMN05421796_11324 [Chryseobacterium piscicola]|uniref:Uncharacterized protein n=1 Tax=Chryseobacterium piscicola TaxID=551459 RepID=A0A1N7PE84_9FLAO|nr:hypothetical protein SAMN05421796_11324 [Chryseobacterium piscicola]
MEENNNQNPARLSPAETVEQIKITTEALNRGQSTKRKT